MTQSNPVANHAWYINLIADTEKLRQDLKKAHEIIRDFEDRIRYLEQWAESTIEAKYSRDEI